MVIIRGEQRPETVTLEPTGEALPFEYRDGEIHLTVPRLDIHAVLVVR